MRDHFDGTLRFERFELDVKSRTLMRDGVHIPLQLQPFRLLANLALRSGETISRESLRDGLWNKQTFVDFEAGLNFCIRQIRKALGEDARHPRLIETLNRRGYRFMAPVERVPRVATEFGNGPKSTSERITVTLGPLGQEANSGAEMRDAEELGRLAEAITQFLVQACLSGERSLQLPLDSATGPLQFSRAVLDRDVSNTLSNQCAQSGVEVSINGGRMEWSLSVHRLM